MQKKVDHLTKNLIRIIAETNGLSLNHTLELLQESARTNESEKKIIREFTKMMHDFQSNKIPIEKLLAHPISESLFKFFKKLSPSLLRRTHSSYGFTLSLNLFGNILNQ